MRRIGAVSLAVIVMVGLCAGAGVASETFWFIHMRLYSGSLGGSPMDISNPFGVRPQATDGYDTAFDSAEPPETLIKPYASLFWYRADWSATAGTNYASDFRSALASGQSKVWQDLRAKSTESGTLLLGWDFGYSWRPDNSPPLDYGCTIYDEGTSPDPNSGTAADMRANSSLSFAYQAGQIRYFHITVTCPPGDRPPQCVITVSPQCLVANQSLAFDSHASTVDGTVVSVDWNFGDGATASGLTTSHSYAAAGSYDVTVTVTDSSGSTGACTTGLPLRASNQPPTCQITFAPSSPVLKAGIRFRSDGVDPEGSSVTVAWDFGDGDMATGTSVNHIYQRAGTYQVTATVNDTCGATGTCTVAVEVGGNHAPTCSISTVPSAPMAGAETRFYSHAQDVDSDPLTIAWDFGDGSTGTGLVAPHRYAAGGTYQVTCTVSDGIATTSCTLTMEVQPAGNNLPPTCNITFEPALALVGDSVSFKADASDAENDPVAVRWDFGDGNSGSGAATTHWYAGAGTYAVTATVSDYYGSGTCTTQVRVVRRPTCSITFTPRQPQAGELVGFESNASSADGTVTSVVWRFGDGSEAEGASATHAYTSEGRFYVSCVVTDSYGSVVVCRAVVVVGEPAVSRSIELISRANDGRPGSANSLYPAISADGRFVAFASFDGYLMLPYRAGFGNSSVYARDRLQGQTTMASMSSNHVVGDGYSGALPSEYNDFFGPRGNSAISGDGRYVAFWSFASNFWPNDRNQVGDIFINDLLSGQLTCSSLTPTGVMGAYGSYFPAISADGHYLAFASRSYDFFPGDTNGMFDVFVRDQWAGQTRLVSMASDGTQGNGDSGGTYLEGGSVSISTDGRHVVFMSWASNLVPGDTNGSRDVFVHDCLTGETTRVSVDSDGSEGNGASYGGRISADGRYVVFASAATNLVPGDTNADGKAIWEGVDVFVHDRLTGHTERVSVASDGIQGNASSGGGSISADGHYVAFDSNAANLVDGDTNGRGDVFVHDWLTGRTARISVAADGAEGNSGSGDAQISADGRYVAFSSRASNLAAGASSSVTGVFAAPNLLFDEPPTGSVTMSPDPPRVGQVVTLDASGSADADGQIVRYEWDLDGDGEFDDASGPVVSCVFADPGEHKVCVRVTDDGMNTSEYCLEDDVLPPFIAVSLVAVQASSNVHLKPNQAHNIQRIQLKVRNDSKDREALITAALHRWRFHTTGAMEPVMTWKEVTVPKHGWANLPPFYYTYTIADRPAIRWRGVVTVLNGTDPHPRDNVKYKQVGVSGNWKAAP